MQMRHATCVGHMQLSSDVSKQIRLAWKRTTSRINSKHAAPTFTFRRYVEDAFWGRQNWYRDAATRIIEALSLPRKNFVTRAALLEFVRRGHSRCLALFQGAEASHVVILPAEKPEQHHILNSGGGETGAVFETKGAF